MMRALAVAVVMITISTFLGSCGGDDDAAPPADQLLTPLAEQYPIDGIVDLASVGTVHEQTIDILDSFGTGTLVKTSTLRWAARNDDRHLYIALEWTDDTQDGFDPATGFAEPFDGLVFLFDGDGDGVLEQDEDAHRLIMNIYSSVYGDIHIDATQGTADDIVMDGRGRMTGAAGTYQAELLIPLAADAAGQDDALSASTPFTIMIYDHIQLGVPSGNIGVLAGPAGLAGVGTDTTAWPLLPYVEPGAYDQPSLPSGLTGLTSSSATTRTPSASSIPSTRQRRSSPGSRIPPACTWTAHPCPTIGPGSRSTPRRPAPPSPSTRSIRSMSRARGWSRKRPTRSWTATRAGLPTTARSSMPRSATGGTHRS